jgi:hydrogenase-4 component B
MVMFGIGLAVLAIGGVLAVVVGKNRWWSSAVGGTSAVAGCMLALADAVTVLFSGRTVGVSMSWDVPYGRLSLGLDPLSAVFVLPIGFVVAVAAVYGTQYLLGPHGPARVGTVWLGFNLLAATMLLVVAARDGLLFLIAWEGMSLASFFLVMSDHRHATVRRAGWTYLVAAHLGTACLLVLFLLLGQRSGSLEFDQFSVEPALAGVLFVLAMIGFGTKAGFIPVHVWLPEAHPAAPSHVSAVMSGVMIKTGIYGLVRVLTFLGEPAAWWGWTLVGVGVSSAVFGVVFALVQHDLKRLLAYSSVENIGIIGMGLGVGLLGIHYQVPAMAALGFAGALLHVINHALFKSLLFLGAGAVQHGTGTREINRLGGLLRRMPVTGTAFLVGAWAIAGLPPLNGFVSEVLIYLAALSGLVDSARVGGIVWVLLGVMVVGGLALIGGLAAACFTMAFGGVFLGEPRSDEAASGHEVGVAMRFSMIVLAAACVLIALTAPFSLPLLGKACATLMPGATEPLFATGADTTVRALAVVCAASWALLAIAGGLLVWRRRLLSGRSVGRGPTWDCGYAAGNRRMQYTASSFASPLAILFRGVLRQRVELQEPAGLFPPHAGFRSETPDLFHTYLFRPVFLAVVWGSAKLRWLQRGRIQLYVLYIAVTVLFLLIWKLG